MIGQWRNIFLVPIVFGFTVVAPVARGVELEDVSQRWTFRYDIVSAFPEVTATIPREENFRAIKVFQYHQDDVVSVFNERRVEVFYTGGDWMQYGNVYFVTNSPNPRHEITPDDSAAYFIKDLSTTDRDDGAVAPAVNPFDDAALKDFIKTKFLDSSGSVAAGFVPVPRP